MGKTILISSHILTELADCCTSIGIIERGQLLMHGPIDEVYRRIRGNRICTEDSILENPVLQRELLVNLRMPTCVRAAARLSDAAGVRVYLAWPQETRLDLTAKP
jgi:ABC-type multidrug transport system ATPase subunit